MVLLGQFGDQPCPVILHSMKQGFFVLEFLLDVGEVVLEFGKAAVVFAFDGIEASFQGVPFIFKFLKKNEKKCIK